MNKTKNNLSKYPNSLYSVRSYLFNIRSKISVLFFLGVFCCIGQVSAIDWSAKWIWQSTDGPANAWMAFRKEVTLTSVPETAIASIGVDSKYWLWINGELVKFEGGAARGPKPGATWYDEVDIKPYLKTGNNTIAILAWYWGRETFKGTHIDSKKGGLVFQVDLGDVDLISDDTWKAKLHPAYDLNSGGGNNRIVPYNVYFNANNSLGDWSPSAWYTSGYDDSSWGTAVEKGIPPTAPWGTLEKSYVTLKDHGLADYVSLKKGSSAITLPYTNNTGATITIEAILPFNKQITPYLDINSAANKVIDISTSNPGNNITAKYTSKAGDQQFEAFSWMNGHAVIYQIPAGVTVNALKYRWTGVGNLVGNFECDDSFYQRLWWMGRNTLYVNARDNFMDCPGRERSLWIGDVSDQASYLFYTMDEDGRQLLKKAINTTVNFSIDGNVIAGQAPGVVNELPTQSLQFVSQAIWQYYLYTGDKETLEDAYSLVKNYLNLWRFDNAKNLIVMKSCTHERCWDFCDWDAGNTIDKLPIFNALYHYALTSAKKMAQVLDKPQADIDWYDNRIDRLQIGFNNAYWNGEFYSSDATKYQDDRVNALSIITGLADESKYKSIIDNVLVPNHFCSPHYEWMIEEAMCKAGYHTEALDRMKIRYEPQVSNPETTTLNEYFTLGKGTDNHAWNAPNTILSKYIAGIAPIEPGWSKYSIFPHMVHLKSLNQTISTVKGNINVGIDLTADTYQVNLVSPMGAAAVVGVPKTNFAASEIKVNGTVIWSNGSFLPDVSIISDQGENEEFIWFELSEGDWTVVATANLTVSFETPLANKLVYPGADLVVKAQANNADGAVASVDLFINEILVRSITASPYIWGSVVSTDALLKNLQEGAYDLKLVVKDNVGNKREASMKILCQKEAPFSGVAAEVPGIVEAEDFDTHGAGFSYYDLDTENTGGAYRLDEEVDITANANGYHVTDIETGEWIKYTINVTKTDNYDIELVYLNNVEGASINAEIEGALLFDAIALPKTADAAIFEVVTVKDVVLTKGVHVLKLNMVQGGFQLDRLAIGVSSNTVQLPYALNAVPGTIQAEDYDIGGEGLAYHDSDDNNQVGEYRDDAVDIGTGGTGYVVAYMATDEWLEYTIKVEKDGSYDMIVAYSSGKPGGGGAMGAEFIDKGVVVVNSFSLDNSGSWSTYKDVTIGNVFLTKGSHALRINVASSGFNLDKIQFVNTDPTSVVEVNTNEERVYPNPSKNGMFNLDPPNQWVVYSLFGKVVASGNGTAIDLSLQPKGLYLLRLNGQTIKLINN